MPVCKCKCPKCGEPMEAVDYFPEPENYPEPISHWECKCGYSLTHHHIGKKDATIRV